MKKNKKRRFKKILITNKNKIFLATMVLFVVLLGVGYSEFNQVLSIMGKGGVALPSCRKRVTGSFQTSGSWPGAEIVSVKVNNYETQILDNFTLELSVPDGTYAGPFTQCVTNTVDGYIYPSASGIITITFDNSGVNNCDWISKIGAATTVNGTVQAGTWGGGSGFSFQLNSSLIDGSNTLTPYFINFEGCTIVGGEGGNQETPLSVLGLSPTEASIGINESIMLTTSKTPAYKDVNLVYTSSDSSIATVSNIGQVMGISPGTVTISVSAEGLIATSTITVEEHVVVPEAISIVPDSYRLIEGESAPLQTSITPSGVSTELTWSSSDSSVAIVDSNGNVTGISAGEAVITVTTSNGVSGTCDIRVIHPVVSNELEISFSHNFEYTHGSSYMFTFTLNNTTNSRINYFKIGLDLPTNVTFRLWQANVRVVDGNYLELITNHYTYIEPNGTFTIQGSLEFPNSVLLDGRDPWGNPAKIIPNEYLTPEITSLIFN